MRAEQSMTHEEKTRELLYGAGMNSLAWAHQRISAALAEAEERGRAAGWAQAKEAAADIAARWGTLDAAAAIRYMPDQPASAPAPTSKIWPAPGIMENWQHPDDRPQQAPAPAIARAFAAEQEAKLLREALQPFASIPVPADASTVSHGYKEVPYRWLWAARAALEGRR